MAGQNSIGIGTVTTRDIVRDELSKFSEDDLKIGIPVKVVNIDKYESTQCVDVVPLINDVYEDGTVIPPQIIRSVFVQLPSLGGFSVKFPVNVNDLGYLKYAHRSLVEFMADTGTSLDVPLKNNTGKINDCVFEAGFGTRSNNLSPSKDNFILEGDNTVITITPSGQITAVTKGAVSVTTESTATVKCSQATIDSPKTNCTGDLDVSGKITCPTIEASTSLKVQSKEVHGHDHNSQVPPFQ